MREKVGRDEAAPEREGDSARTPTVSPVRLIYAQRSSCRTPWPDWLACASMAVPACCRMFDAVYLTISAAMSVSAMRLLAAARFSAETCSELIVDSKRFWIAPRSARADETLLIDASTVVPLEEVHEIK